MHCILKLDNWPGSSTCQLKPPYVKILPNLASIEGNNEHLLKSADFGAAFHTNRHSR